MYESVRGSSLAPIVEGIIETVAEEYFSIGVILTQICSQGDCNESKQTVWRIEEITTKCVLAEDASSNNSSVQDQIRSYGFHYAKCPFSQNNQSNYLAASELPDKDSASNLNSSYDRNMAASLRSKSNTPPPQLLSKEQPQQQQYGLSMSQLNYIFPFHVVFDYDSKMILQHGPRLGRFLNRNNNNNSSSRHRNAGTADSKRSVASLVNRNINSVFELIDSSAGGSGVEASWDTLLQTIRQQLIFYQNNSNSGCTNKINSYKRCSSPLMDNMTVTMQLKNIPTTLEEKHDDLITNSTTTTTISSQFAPLILRGVLSFSDDLKTVSFLGININS